MKKNITKLKKAIHKRILQYCKMQLIKNNFAVNYKEVIKHNEIIIENFFKTNYSKNALIAYVVNPFINNNPYFHSNQSECTIIAKILNELNYNVDIINWDNSIFIPKKEYHIVIDNNNILERLNGYFKNTIKILHISATHWLYQNRAELERIQEIYEKKGVLIQATRLLQPSKSIEYCDFATCLGNSFTAETYKFAKKTINFIPVSSTIYFPYSEEKNLQESKKNFLWFGSKGFALKGLDIVLETFAELPNYNLTICAPTDTEREFCKAYYKEMYETKNIKTVGWIDVKSNEFKEILYTHGAVISLSFSEGGGSSVITCMTSGLIPIVSKSNSVDVFDFGFTVNTITKENLILTIKQFDKLPLKEMKLKRKKAYIYASEKHSITAFKNSFTEVLVQAIKRKIHAKI